MKFQWFIHRLLVVLGSLSIVIGVGYYFQQYIPRTLLVRASSLEEISSVTAIPESHPVTLSLEGIDLELPIFQSAIENGSWETTSLGVSSLTNPEEAGASGGLVIYGHNWASILGRLHQSQVGELLQIAYADGDVKEYEIEKIATVSPSDFSLIEKSGDDSLVLYTCAGLFDSQRLVVVASAI